VALILPLFITMTKNQIEGIYNYCNRWCEKCPFQDRCAIFESSFTDDTFENKQNFINKISITFKDTIEELEKIAKDYGIDLDEDPILEIPKPRKSYLVESWATTYREKTWEWFENDPLLNNTCIEEVECLRVNSMIIGSKIHRALHNDVMEIGEFMDEVQNDSNGSAKVALVVINQSIEAWDSIRKKHENLTNKIIDMYLILSKIKKKLIHNFPRAMDFHRPGFDD
jgi:hypothetical protein